MSWTSWPGYALLCGCRLACATASGKTWGNWFPFMEWGVLTQHPTIVHHLFYRCFFFCLLGLNSFPLDLETKWEKDFSLQHFKKLLNHSIFLYILLTENKTFLRSFNLVCLEVSLTVSLIFSPIPHQFLQLGRYMKPWIKKRLLSKGYNNNLDT